MIATVLNVHISRHIIETCPVSCGVICTCCRPVLQTVCYARLHMAAQHVFQMCRTVLKEFDLRAEAQAGVNNIITNIWYVFLQMGYCDWGDLSHFFGTVVGLLGQSSSNNATVMLRHGEFTGARWLQLYAMQQECGFIMNDGHWTGREFI